MARPPLWIFGYGSLVWRPAFPYAERHPGWVEGYARRFWQGSPDHRGVVGAPGRVVTLLPRAELPRAERVAVSEPTRCWGMVYRVAEGHEDAVLAGLDHREKAGYERLELPVLRPAGAPTVERALVYLARPGNSDWLGAAPLAEIAAQIRRSHGPSGSNREYLLRLAEALAHMGAEDEHVTALARLVQA